MYSGLELRRSPELRDTLTLGGTRPVSTNLYINYFESNIGAREPIPNLGWESPAWRVCGPSPGGRNSLELFAESVASYRAPMITTGGFIVGTLGNNPQVTEFAKAYRPLPAERFETLQGFSDTAVVRYGEGGYLYAVSRSPFSLAVKLKRRKPVDLIELSDGSGLHGEEFTIALKPYQLRSFRGNIGRDDLAIAGYDLPPERKELILRTVERLKANGERGGGPRRANRARAGEIELRAVQVHRRGAQGTRPVDSVIP